MSVDDAFKRHGELFHQDLCSNEQLFSAGFQAALDEIRANGAYAFISTQGTLYKGPPKLDGEIGLYKLPNDALPPQEKS